jgi:predicted RNA methylase
VSHLPANSPVELAGDRVNRPAVSALQTPSASFGVAALRMNVLASDHEFDQIYDERIQALSDQHWTPVRVAARAAQLLTQAGSDRILDVGAGVGKFCLVGALTTDAHFVGVEWREDLVDIARGAAITLQVDRVTFLRRNVEDFAFDAFNGVYLYNPFWEQVGRYVTPIDDSIERSRAAFDRLVNITIAKLAAMRPPVAVVTFHGFGDDLPREFVHAGHEPAASDQLELWVKK